MNNIFSVQLIRLSPDGDGADRDNFYVTQLIFLKIIQNP